MTLLMLIICLLSISTFKLQMDRRNTERERQDIQRFRAQLEASYETKVA